MPRRRLRGQTNPGIYTMYPGRLEWNSSSVSSSKISRHQLQITLTMAPVRPTSTSTWMTSLPDKNIPLTQLTIPGTHDSFCSENKIETGFASFNKPFAACQHDSFTIENQLRVGIRLLDFRVEFDGKLSHGVARLDGNLYEQIRIVANFLEANPGETVLVSVKWEKESVEGWSFEVRGSPEPEGEAGRIIQRLREVLGAKWWMERKFPSL